MGVLSFSVREAVYLTVAQGGSCRKRMSETDFICSSSVIVQLCFLPTLWAVAYVIPELMRKKWRAKLNESLFEAMVKFRGDFKCLYPIFPFSSTILFQMQITFPPQIKSRRRYSYIQVQIIEGKVRIKRRMFKIKAAAQLVIT
jgi:hypothetical protein